jgi:hypothetical protein
MVSSQMHNPLAETQQAGKNEWKNISHASESWATQNDKRRNHAGNRIDISHRVLLWVGPGYDPEKSFHVPC